MRKTLALVLLMASATVAPVVRGQQDATRKARGGEALPANCNPGGSNVIADMIVVGATHYLCTSTNTWTAVGGAGSDTTWNAPQRFKGIDPWADITAFGAIAINPFSIPTTTATCIRGSTTVTTTRPFLNGWGMTIYGCGVTNTMPKPSAPTVTPVPAVAGTSPLPSLVGPPLRSPLGNSTYKYAVVAADQHGGLTAASEPTTIANGLASIGLTNLPITTMTRSGATVTVNTSGKQILTVGSQVHIRDSSDPTFSGFFNVATVNNTGNSFTVTGTAFDTRRGATTSAKGGDISYYNGIQIVTSKVAGAYKYYICAQRPEDSTMHVIGTTAPTAQSGGGYPSFWYIDYGAKQMGKQTYPSYVTDATCTSTTPTNDYLTSKVVSGGGTNSIVIANAAVNSVSGTPAVFDDAPAIFAAANSINWNAPGYVGGTVYVPPVPAAGARLVYVINSYLKLPPNTNIKEAGSLYLNDTLELQGNFRWQGDWIAAPNGLFGFIGGSQVSVGAANPGIYTNGAQGSVAENLNISSNGTNGGVLWVADDPYNQQWSNDSFDTNFNGAGDYIGLGLMIRSTTTGGNPVHFDHVSFSGGPTQSSDASWAPLLLFPINLNNLGNGPIATNYLVDMKTMFFARRGVEMQAFSGTLGYFDIDWLYRQGGITPLFTLYNYSGSIYSSFNLRNSMQDTETSPTLALLNQPLQTIKSYITFDHVSDASQEVSGTTPAISGQAPYSLNINQSDIRQSEVFALITDSLGIHSNMIQATPGTFALLPKCGSGVGEGTLSEITDSATNIPGATVTGGGSYKATVRCDGVNWTLEAISGPSAAVMVATLITTDATSDNVNVNGLTKSGHCTMTPTNAIAAGDIASTYISDTTTNRITITHPARSGRSWNVHCTAN